MSDNPGGEIAPSGARTKTTTIMSNAESDNTYARNAERLKARWPHHWELIKAATAITDCRVEEAMPQATLVVHGIHLTSCVDRLAEARLQAEAVPAESTVAWVFGIGVGDLIRVLLEREALKELNVVPLSYAVLRTGLDYLDHTGWLDDPRVELVDPASLIGMPYPFAATPAMLGLADERAARIRDKVHLELSTAYLRDRCRYVRVYDTSLNLEANRELLAHDPSVAGLFGSREGERIYVASAGPTLMDNIDWLKENRGDACLIAVDAALSRLIERGVIPDFVLTQDVHPEGVERYFEVDLANLNASCLIYFPASPPGVMAKWPGRRAVGISPEESGNEYATRFVGGELFSSGTVFHPAIDLGVRLGAREIVMLGADFGFPEGRIHASEKAMERKEYQSQAESAGRHWILNGHGERIATQPNLRGYLRDLEDYITEHPEVRFYNTSRKGAAIHGAHLLEIELREKS